MRPVMSPLVCKGVTAPRFQQKLKTLVQNFAIGGLLFHYETLGLPMHACGLALLSLATALTLWSGYAYFAEYFRSAEREEFVDRWPSP